MDSKRLHEKYKRIEIDGLPNSFFKTNRDKFFNNIKNKFSTINKNIAIILQGGSDQPRYDTDILNNYFLQESNFYYLTGVRNPDFFALLDFKQEDIILFTSVLPEDYKVSMTVLNLEEYSKKYDIKVLDKSKMYEIILSNKYEKVYIIEGINSDSGIKYKAADLKLPESLLCELDKKDRKERLDKIVEKSELLYEIMVDTRIIKSPEEIEILTFINDITVDSHIDVLKKLKPGLLERDMEMAFSTGINQKYYTRSLPYEHICCSGTDAATLHYNKNDNIFLFDMILEQELRGIVQTLLLQRQSMENLPKDKRIYTMLSLKVI